MSRAPESSVERLELPGCREQQRRSVAAAARGERDLARSSSTWARCELVQRPRLRQRQQAERRVGRAGLVLGLRRGERALGPARRIGRQLGGAFEECRRRRQAAARLRPPGRRSSSAATSSSGPAAACARCQARRSGSTSGSVDLRQRPVHLPPLAAATRPGRPPSAPAGAGTAPGADLEQPGGDAGSRGRVGRCPSRSAARHTSTGSPTGSAAATSSSRRVSAGSASSRRRKLSSIRLGQRLRARQPEAARELGGRQPARQLQQRQRVAARLRDDPVAHPLVERARDRRVAAAPARRASRRPPTASSGRPANSCSSGSRAREHQRHRLGRQPARDEGQGLRRRPVEPLRVVDDADQRLLRRRPPTAG